MADTTTTRPLDWPDLGEMFEHLTQQQINNLRFFNEQPVFRDRRGTVVEHGDRVQCFSTLNDVVYRGTIVMLYLEYPTAEGGESHIAIVKAEPNSHRGQLCYCDSLQLVERGPRNTIEDLPMGEVPHGIGVPQDASMEEPLVEYGTTRMAPVLADLERLKQIYPRAEEQDASIPKVNATTLPASAWIGGKCPTTGLPRDQSSTSASMPKVDPKDYE